MSNVTDQIQDLEKRAAELSTHVVSLQEQINQHKDTLSVLETEREELVGVIDGLKKKREEQESTEIKDLSAERVELDALKEKLALEQAARDQIKTELDNLAQDLRQREENLLTVNKDIQERSSALSKREQDLADKDAVISARVAEISARDLATKEVEERNLKLAMELVEERKQFDEDRKFLSGLMKEHEAVSESLSQRKQALENQERSISERSLSIEQKAADLAERENALSEKDAELKKLAESLENEQKRLDVLQLRMNKIIREKGIEKELADLQQSPSPNG